MQEYDEVRRRIFGEELDAANKKSRNYVKISRLREKSAIFRKRQIQIESSILTTTDDNRPYAKVQIEGEEILGLLDSGASVTCLGKGAIQFITDKNIKLTKMDHDIKTADGNHQKIEGRFNSVVSWGGKSQELEIFVVPGLQQPLYLGVDFWSSFKVAPNIVSELDAPSLSKEQPSFRDLSLAQAQQLERIKLLFPSFATLGLGKTSLEEHIIEVDDEQIPIKQRHHPISPVVQKLLYEELDRMLALGVIEESNSAWSSPVVLVRKGGKSRLCLDSRKVNARTKKFAYPLPHIEGIISRLQDTKYISSIDLKDAFWQIPLESKSSEKTAFTVPGRPLYQFTVMPFGLCNAAQRMSKLMDKVIPGRLRQNVFVYLDDLLICSPDFETHVKVLEEVANCLRQAGLTINVEKSKFCFKEIKYLGYVVGDGCIRTDKDKVSAVEDFPIPKTPKQLRRFLGMTGWYRRFIPNYATIAASMTDCLKKGQTFQMTDDATTAFQLLKTSLVTAPILTNPDFSKHFYIQCDASTSGVGSVIFQMDEEKNERPIAFMSQKLNSAQRNYTVTELECYAAVLSVKKFRAYVEGLPFTIITDHASLKWLMTQKDLAGRLARWSFKLQGFDFVIEHRKGVQNVVPDTLSRVHMEEITTENLAPEVDFNSPYFFSEEYAELKKTIQRDQDKLPDICISDGFVYKRTDIRTGDAIQDDRAWKLWVPKELCVGLLTAAHDSPASGHGGINKTLSKLRQKYFWPGMATDVQQWVKSCDICKCSKSVNITTRPPMGQQTVTERPFQRLYIDFLGPYPRTKNGNTHIFIVLDHFSKFVFLKAIRKATSSEVVKFLEESVFHVFGVPEYVHSDNGKQFVSELFSSFLTRYGVKHVRTAIYSPQANASERVNQSVLSKIRSYLGEDQKHWDQHVSNVSFSLRSVVHDALTVEPYYAVFGTHMIQHAKSYELLRKLNLIKESKTEILNKEDRLEFIRAKIFDNLRLAHQKSAKTYNTRSRDEQYKIGQVFFRRNFKQSNAKENYNAKLGKKFLKSIILKPVGNSLYVVGNLNGEKVGVYHAKDLHV